MFRWNSGLVQGALRDFAEHIRFRELFGTDDDIGSRRRISQESRNAGKEQKKIWDPGNHETLEFL
jgi:hypothetical protein